MTLKEFTKWANSKDGKEFITNSVKQVENTVKELKEERIKENRKLKDFEATI